MDDIILFLTDEEDMVLSEDAGGDIDLEFADPISEHYEHYTGGYELTPVLNYEQTLETQYKVMDDDVIIHPIPVITTTNPYGGKTVVIG